MTIRGEGGKNHGGGRLDGIGDGGHGDRGIRSDGGSDGFRSQGRDPGRKVGVAHDHRLMRL